MNQTEIFDFFEQKISKSAIQKIDDEWQVVGKWCRVSFDTDGTIDTLRKFFEDKEREQRGAA